MNVSEVKFKAFTKGKLCGFADVTFDDQLKITGLVVFKTDDVVSFAMPSKKKDDEYYDTVFCLDADLRAEILTGIKEKMGIVDSGEEDNLPF